MIHCSFKVINSLKFIVPTPYTPKRNKNTLKCSKFTLTPLPKNHILLTPKMTAIRLRGCGKWPSFLLSDWPCRSALCLWVLLLLWQSFEINWSPLWPEREQIGSDQAELEEVIVVLTWEGISQEPQGDSMLGGPSRQGPRKVACEVACARLSLSLCVWY